MSICLTDACLSSSRPGCWVATDGDHQVCLHIYDGAIAHLCNSSVDFVLQELLLPTPDPLRGTAYFESSYHSAIIWLWSAFGPKRSTARSTNCWTRCPMGVS